MIVSMRKATLCLVFVLMTISITGCTAVSDGSETTDKEAPTPINKSTDTTDNNAENNQSRMTSERNENEFTLSGFVAEDVPENATVVEYNGSLLENSERMAELLDEIRSEGKVTNKEVGGNASELYGDLPIFVPENGAVWGPEDRPYPPGVYVRYKNEIVFLTDGIEK